MIDMYNGVREMIEAEKELEKSNEGDSKYHYTGEGFPQFDPKYNSALKRHLTEDIWNQLKDLKDPYGCTIRHVINSGYRN